jgi:exopolysaccharide biosynthesis polyprenyl glycosylphosphotransferase
MSSQDLKKHLSSKRNIKTLIMPQELSGDLGELFQVDRRVRYSRLDDAMKRMLDLFLSALMVLALTPLLLIIAILIKADSKGPVIFKQTRIGKDKKPFTFYKFRSMAVNSDDEIHKKYVTELICNSSKQDLKGESGSYKIENDPRVTRIGSFIRCTSIDELPQLINVIKGEMSLVGPRPALPYEVELYSAKHLNRLRVVPGITGWWQVNGRCEIDFEEMVDLDLQYIRRRSVIFDLNILLKTIPTILGRKGAW